jgi:hypothetical protein
LCWPGNRELYACVPGMASAKRTIQLTNARGVTSRTSSSEKEIANQAERAHARLFNKLAPRGLRPAGEQHNNHGDELDRFGRSGGPTANRRERGMNSEPTDLDKHRGMAARKAVSIRRVLAEVEKNARELRDRQATLEHQLLSTPADSWPEAAAKARYILNLYAASLAPDDTRHRDLVAAVFEDFARLSNDG